MSMDSIHNIPQWNELDYYKEGQKIYGRDEEIWKVSNGIINNLQTVLYGRSGIGKSSLLYAGVFPKLRKEFFFPIFVRLGMREESSYSEAVINAVFEEAQRTDKSIGKYFIKAHNIPDDIDVTNESNSIHELYDFFNKTQFVDNVGSLYIPVLVFDQFEEILNNRETHIKAETFLKELYTLIDDNRISRHEYMPYDNFRVVISLREDYLYCLEDVIDKYHLTELKYNRFRICAMNDKNAREVILRTSGSSLENGREDDICNWIIQESKNYMGEINTLILSLICSTCYLNAEDGIIKYADLKKCDDYLFRYYSNKMDTVPPYTRNYLEKVLVTSDGRRSSVDMIEAIHFGLISEDEIKRLAEIRLLRVVISGDNSRRIEFIHDKLTSVIRSYKRTIVDRFINVIKNAFVFSGVSDRQEWNITIFLFLFLFIYYIFDWCFNESKGLYVCNYLFILFAILNFSTSIRRCHDIGISGWNFIRYYWALGVKPSSTSPYKGSISCVSWRKMRLQFSLTSTEFKALNLYGIYMFFLFFILLKMFLEGSKLLSGIFTFYAHFFFGLSALMYFGTIFIARLASVTHIANGIIPILNIKYWFQAFSNYENEIIIPLNRFSVLCCGYFAINNNGLVYMFIWYLCNKLFGGL